MYEDYNKVKTTLDGNGINNTHGFIPRTVYPNKTNVIGISKFLPKYVCVCMNPKTHKAMPKSYIYR